MEIIYIGTSYSNTVSQAEEIPFANAPYVVMYSQTSKKWFAATVTPADQEQKCYTFTFPAATTQHMIPGTYSLEVYSDSNKTEMLKRIDEFAKLVYAASSPGSIQPSNS